MRRGEVWWVNFNPSVGGETQKQRPSVIISNDASNKFLRLQVVPLTSNVERLYPSEAYVILNSKQSKAMADQLTTVSKTRLLNSIGRLLNADLNKFEHAIKVQLGLNL